MRWDWKMVAWIGAGALIWLALIVGCKMVVST